MSEYTTRWIDETDLVSVLVPRKLLVDHSEIDVAKRTFDFSDPITCGAVQHAVLYSMRRLNDAAKKTLTKPDRFKAWDDACESITTNSFRPRATLSPVDAKALATVKSAHPAVKSLADAKAKVGAEGWTRIVTRAERQVAEDIAARAEMAEIDAAANEVIKAKLEADANATPPEPEKPAKKGKK